jgi:FkbM family methyltransferase
VDPADDVVSRFLLDSGTYGEADLALATSLLSPTAHVLLVGAHIGALAIPLSRHCQTMIAIEANPHTFQLLELNLRLNLCRNIETVQVAAAERSGTISFLLNRDNSGGSKRMPVHQDLAYVYDNPQIVEVAAMRLDALPSSRPVDLVLMDIEGSEYFALQGMPRILGEAQALMIEFVPHHLQNVADVTVHEWLAPILPHFSWMYVPQHDQVVASDRAEACLQPVFDSGQTYDSIIFLKASLPRWLQAKISDDGTESRRPTVASPARPERI